MSHEQETPIIYNYNKTDVFMDWFLLIFIAFLLLLGMYFMLNTAIYLAKLFDYSIITIFTYEVLIFIIIMLIYKEIK